jgi:hypothetical protein
VVEDPEFSRTRDAKLYKTTKLFWVIKALIAQVIEEMGTQQ